jgi:hypothetical protein
MGVMTVTREMLAAKFEAIFPHLDERQRRLLVGAEARARLADTVEVDETYVGGEEPGLRGGRAKGKKSLVGVAVEVKEPRGYGRCRMEVLADASAASLHPFLTRHVEPGATVITDAWMGYHGIAGLGYAHDRRSQRAAPGSDRMRHKLDPRPPIQPPVSL